MEDKNLKFYQTVGARIKEIRIAKGMSQAELAEKANLALPSVSTIENAKSKMWLVSFARICEALQVSPNEILRLDVPESTGHLPEEFAAILDGCTAAEIESILKITKQVKYTFEDQKKEYID